MCRGEETRASKMASPIRPTTIKGSGRRLLRCRRCHQVQLPCIFCHDHVELERHRTFNNSADKIDKIAAQVGVGDTSGGSTTPNDHYCWMRPEDIDYPRPVFECHSCSDLAAEMAAALASASIVFKDNKAYSQKLVHGARNTLFSVFQGSKRQLATHPKLAKHAGAFWGGPDYGVFSWDNKLIRCSGSFEPG
ncbi:hypothetical protein V6N11_064377 [Hibiscus sabdariffa]|uniref:cellulase n=1 Tax=Hibiscus sabdariffa TaxID=183260 RepID=A0ABR2PNH1_9ROSI